MSAEAKEQAFTAPHPVYLDRYYLPGETFWSVGPVGDNWVPVETGEAEPATPKGPRTRAK